MTAAVAETGAARRSEFWATRPTSSAPPATTWAPRSRLATWRRSSASSSMRSPTSRRRVDGAGSHPDAAEQVTENAGELRNAWKSLHWDTLFSQDE